MEILLKNPKLTLRLPTQEDVLGFFEHLKKSKITKDDANKVYQLK